MDIVPPVFPFSQLLVNSLGGTGLLSAARCGYRGTCALCVSMHVCVWLPVITALMEILHGSQLSISSSGDCCDSQLLNSKA